MKKLTTLLLLIFFALQIAAQDKEAPTPSSITMVTGAFGLHFPGGDLVNRFGTSMSAGPGFMYKTDANWLWGVQMDFIFGNQVKEDDLFSHIETERGYIIDASGLYTDVFLSERGFSIGPMVGKVIPLVPDNPNSGLLITLSPGLLQHKIRIDNRNNTAPQLDKEYLKGYDRLTNGFMLNSFLGYFHSGKYRLVSFYAGIELKQAWTKSRRDWDFDTMEKNDSQRLDLLTGFKVGWVIQLSKSGSSEYFYY